MAYSCNKTTLIIAHGLATSLLIKQPIASRALVLGNAALNVYVNNFNKTDKLIHTSNAIQFITAGVLAKQTTKNKQVKRWFIAAITISLLDLIQ